MSNYKFIIHSINILNTAYAYNNIQHRKSTITPGPVGVCMVYVSSPAPPPIISNHIPYQPIISFISRGCRINDYVNRLLISTFCPTTVADWTILIRKIIMNVAITRRTFPKPAHVQRTRTHIHIPLLLDVAFLRRKYLNFFFCQANDEFRVRIHSSVLFAFTWTNTIWKPFNKNFF